MASFGGDLHDGFRRKGTLPLSQSKFLDKFDSQFTVDGESDSVVSFEVGMLKCFL
jgi:hypothetical protein